jgi:CRISPR-associated endoribonuclease Cas6
MIYELVFRVFLKKDYEHREMLLRIAKNISYVLCKEGFEKFHNSNEIKHYSFSNLAPVAIDGIYKAYLDYIFVFRTLNKEIADILKTNLKRQKKDFIVFDVKERIKDFRFVRKIKTVTPLIILYKDYKNCWIKGDDYSILVNRLEENLKSKYFSFFRKEIELKDNIFRSVNILNKKPQSIFVEDKKDKDKRVKILGIKAEFEISRSKEAQKLIHVAFASGLGYKNALGAGFIKEAR